MKKVSIVINCDTRTEKNNQDGLFSGVVNTDFLSDGIHNKLLFFKGFETELVVVVDEHNPIPEKELEYLRKICDTLIIKKHREFPGFNDINYFTGLAACTGDIIAHFDQDSAAFTSSPESVQRLINLLDTYDYVSYPSSVSPNPVIDPSFNFFWASTRFFMCKRETLDFSELIKCRDYEYYIKTYNPSRVHPWTEHWLSAISMKKGGKVFYPPMDLNQLAIFSWGSYTRFTLMRLNELPYEKVREFIFSKGGIHYPCDVSG